MTGQTSPDTLSRSTLLLVAGRAVGFVAVFAIPVVLARIFTPAEFGTYKQLFLVFATLYGLAQLGMAESLYYFVPSRSDQAGRHVANALVTLAVAGIGCLALLYVLRIQVADWLTNAQLADHLTLIGVALTLTLVTALFEIVMIARKRHLAAAVTYASSDVARTLLFIIPAFGFGGVRGLLIGAVAFGVLRMGAMLVYLWREFGRGLRIDFIVWRRQLAYALPFALAVSVEVVIVNFHQYFVASRFDAATFAIYAVGCLQIPLIDLVMTSTVNVMMVQMADHARVGDARAALALWHDTICRLAFIFLPLTALLLVTAHQLIVTLFTATYVAAVPVFMIWTLTILPSAFAVDGVLRVYAQTRFLLVMNVVRFALVVGLIGSLLSSFGLRGAVLVTLLAMGVVKGLGIVRAAQLFGARFSEALPWRRLAGITLCAVLAAVPALVITLRVALPPLAVLACACVAYAATYLALSYGSRTAERPELPWSFATRRRVTQES
jgi:O-antigen/teichoic acid export membrane protein